MKSERKAWFEDFKKDLELTSSNILKFHNTAGKGNEDYGVIMDRFYVKTTSITQISKNDNDVIMSFENLQTKEKSQILDLEAHKKLRSLSAKSKISDSMHSSEYNILVKE